MTQLDRYLVLHKAWCILVDAGEETLSDEVFRYAEAVWLQLTLEERRIAHNPWVPKIERSPL